MYLKRIVLHGFKSFADRTDFDFDAGITGVVGPNGCGKSNLLDAVRWVLGEQSAKTLRGSKMLDVIFSGSRSRKPANFAEVQFTFDNTTGILACDDREVTVGRTLYRSGDSEYRMNGKVCRLKDIRDLFLDTGVGVDAYSVIEQGRVDAMLRANPLQRRELFEEAAGISRYKVRRAEAQRKLERTQQNLLRLNDVVEELEKRLRSVKLAAGKARNFQEYDARLRELRSTYSLAEYHQLSQHVQTLSRKVQSFEDVAAAKRVDLARRDAEAAELEQQRQVLDDSIQEAEAALLSVQTEAGAIIERISQGQRRLEELGEARTRYAAQVGQIAARLEGTRAKLAEAEAALRDLEAAERAAGENVERLRTQRNEAAARTVDGRKKLDQEKNAAFEAARQVTVLRNEQANLEEQARRLEAQAKALDEQAARLDTAFAELNEKRERIETRVQELDHAISDLSERLRGIEGDLREIESQQQACNARIAELKERRSALASRLGVLEDLERRQDGVGRGARTVLEWRDRETSVGGVIGLVADVLLIDDPRVAALQAVLSRFENHVLVREGHAFLAEYERQEEAVGSIGVIALDRVTSEMAAERYVGAPGVIARAADWVCCEPEYKALAERLLGRVFIVDETERALALAAGAPDGYTFVTLEGCTVDSDGQIAVGATREVSGSISRKAEIRRLGAELDEVETEVERATRERAALAERISDTRLGRESLLQQIAEKQKHHADAKNELVRMADEATRNERERKQVARDAESVDQSRTQVAERARQIEIEHGASERQRGEREARIDELACELGEAEAHVAEIARGLTEAEVEIGRASERRRARQEALNELRNGANALDEERQRFVRQAEQAGERIAAAEREVTESKARRVELEAVCEQADQALLTLREQRQGLRRRSESSSAVVRRMHQEIEAVDQALRDANVELREIEVRRENLTARVMEDLSLDLAELYTTYEHADQDWDAIRDEIEELKTKIARLGNVNLDAITELEELTPRYENLSAQRVDLIDSIDRLEKLIEELDIESRNRFLQCFKEVRENFQDLYRKLFGGGKADVYLENEEDPLECGIEIVARPPGKEPQTLMLLSGGEKTMTAVALLLAVFKRKPSPFAFLDEVDAALDEANIDRFNTVLQEFLENSQFIVITHSKRTMQCADVLYGVTMEEPGVSKRVSVRFDDRVDTPNVA